MILTLDTATRRGRFALADATGLLAERPHNVGGSFADALLPIVQEMLDTAGRTRDQVRAVGVTTGPGSFTGVRIGVATAKGLAWALGCELVGVGTLAAMAAALLAGQPEVEVAVPVLDARRGELFAGVFRRQGSWVEAAAPPAARKPDVWWQEIRRTVTDLDHIVLGGDGTTLLLGQGDDLRPELKEKGTPTLRRWSSDHPATARALALAMADPEADLPRVHPFALVPEYLRASDAEVKRGLDLTPTDPSGDVSSHRSERTEP